MVRHLRVVLVALILTAAGAEGEGHLRALALASAGAETEVPRQAWETQAEKASLEASTKAAAAEAVAAQAASQQEDEEALAVLLWNHLAFDCHAEAVTEWSDGKKEWCCNKAGLGCLRGEYREEEFEGEREVEGKPEGEAKGEGEAEAEGEEEKEEEEEEEVEVSSTDIQVACMLLGSVAFVMSLFYLVNYPDDDIRRYTWNIISTTISIFLAVLFFSGVNQVIIKMLLKQPAWIMCCVHFSHCALYLTVMQIIVALVSGAIGEPGEVNLKEEHWVINDAMRWNNGQKVDENRVRTKTGKTSVMIDDDNMEVPVQKRKVELETRQRRMKSYATLLAHMGGFAAINAGGALQHLKVFRSSPAMSFVPVVLTALIIVTYFHVCKLFRDAQTRKAQQAGRAGVRARMCNEEVEEAENDVLSLGISFLSIQTIRFAISGVFPNVEGLEEPEFPHSRETVYGMYALGLVFALLSCCCIFIIARVAGPTVDEEERESSILARAMNTMLQCFAMMFAWSLLWGTRWVHCWLRETLPIFNVETMMGRVVLALELSALACVCVFALDVVDDAHRGGEDSQTGARALQTIINALGILVGFSWEHCFEHGVTAVASQSSHQEYVKLAMGLTVVLLISPAWRRHILMKSIMLQQLKEDREKAKKHGPDGKHYEHLGGVTSAAGAASGTYAHMATNLDPYSTDVTAHRR